MGFNLEKLDKLIVDTKLGKVCGLERKSVTKSFPDTTYYSFQGIPYAKPPLGPLRFRAPQPPDPWDDILDATQEGNVSPQMNLDGEITGDEDCLFLNVYTPVKPDDDPTLLPVMFWIHGGGFSTGSGGYTLFSPDYLMPLKNIVLVTINYRLGAFGFLICDDPKIGIPGNAGCKDVVMALKWVKSNIANFNGDPNNVTIWGQSAGANIVHSLLISPMASGLFHKAILHSGIFFPKFYPGENKLPWITEVLSKAGYETNNELEAIEFLSKQSTEEVVKTYEKFRRSAVNHTVSCLVMENKLSLEEAFLNEVPETYYLENRINAVPILIGTNADDGLVFSSKESYGAIIPESVAPNTIVPPIIKSWGSENSEEFGRKIVAFYYGKETPSRRNLDKYSKLSSDTAFNLGFKHFTQLYQMITTQPIYRFRFMVESPYNLYKKIYNIQVPCVCHGDELTYLFHSKYSRIFRPGSVEELTLYRLTRLWTNFAATGDPNLPTHKVISNVNWLPIQQGQLNYLHIGKSLKYKPKCDRDEEVRFQFWDDLIDTYFETVRSQVTDEKDMTGDIKNFGFQLKLIKNCQDVRL